MLRKISSVALLLCLPTLTQMPEQLVGKFRSTSRIKRYRQKYKKYLLNGAAGSAVDWQIGVVSLWRNARYEIQPELLSIGVNIVNDIGNAIGVQRGAGFAWHSRRDHCSIRHPH